MREGQERRGVTGRALRDSIVSAAFSVGLLLGGVVTGLFWAWPAWLFLVLGVGVAVQVVIWVRWRMSVRRVERR